MTCICMRKPNSDDNAQTRVEVRQWGCLEPLQGALLQGLRLLAREARLDSNGLWSKLAFDFDHGSNGRARALTRDACFEAKP